MSLKRILLVLPVVVFLFSCNKEDSSPAGNPTAAAILLNVAYGSEPLQNMDVYLPAGRTTGTTKVMIIIHGGAWVTGDKADLTTFVDSFRRRLPGYAFFNINYRLSANSSNEFPTQEMDVKKAVEFIFNKRNEYAISDNFTMAGASAGAHLALLQAYKYSTPVKPKLVVDFFGPADMNDLYNNPGLVSATLIESIVGGTPVSNPALYFQSSPVNFATASAGTPTIIIQGGADPLVNADRQSGALNRALLAAGVQVQYVLYPGLGHGDWLPIVYTDAYNKIQNFITIHNP